MVSHFSPNYTDRIVIYKLVSAVDHDPNLFIFCHLFNPTHLTALQRLRCSTNVEDDIEEMRIEDRAQKEESRVRDTELASLSLKNILNFKPNSFNLPFLRSP